jgi:hypothetical protein
MWDNFIGQQIRRCNRKLLISNIVLVGAVIIGYGAEFHQRAVIAYAFGFDHVEEVVSIPLSLLALWNFVKWKKRTADFSCHPICKRLADIGPIEQVVQQIETAIQANSKDKPASVVLIDSNVFYTSFMLFGPWLFKKKLFGLTCFYVPDVVWLYKKITSSSVNFIPTGKSFAVVLYDRHESSMEIHVSEQEATLLMRLICQQNPWAAVGFDKHSKRLWRWERRAFIAAVDERRKECSKAAAATART